jgi:hypothetical protein
MRRLLTIVCAVVLVGACLVGFWLVRTAESLNADARSQVTRWADQLHSQTTDAGIYIRHPGNQLPEDDPWGTPLSIAYAQGGVMETLTVRSAGPDRAFYTEDDITVHRSVVNLKGIGKGAKDNIEEFAHHGARGLTKGAVEGIKDSFHETRRGKPPVQPK